MYPTLMTVHHNITTLGSLAVCHVILLTFYFNIHDLPFLPNLPHFQAVQATSFPRKPSTLLNMP